MFNIVGAMFADESEARQAMDALIETPRINGTTIYQISLVKRKDGKLKLCDNYTSDYLATDDALKGGVIGGLVGLLSGPIGVLLGETAGLLIGDAVETQKKHGSQDLIERVAQRLEEGHMALIMSVEEADEGILDHMLVKYNTIVVRFDAEAIAKEVEEAEKRVQARAKRKNV